METKICIINTGGTIGMRDGPQGLRPEPGFILEQLSQMPELARADMPRWEVIEYDPVLDSSNMTPQDWFKIASDVAARHEDYSGFVVLHGTDTMAYTASALPFMLPGLSKPVILTGSQLPIGAVRNDARENLITSIILAANYQIPEVCILFGDRLLRGCRATKTSATRFGAFDSPNYGYLATIGTDIRVNHELVLASPDVVSPMAALPILQQGIATFRLFPGVCVEVLQNALKRPLRAIVLETFGDGNGPAQNQPFLDALCEANEQGTVILNCSQCRHGDIRQSHYETGTALARAGAIPGRDLTIEAALAKLMFLFSREFDSEQVKVEMGKVWVGEMSET